MSWGASSSTAAISWCLIRGMIAPSVLWFRIHHCILLHTYLYKSHLWCHSAYRPWRVSRDDGVPDPCVSPAIDSLVFPLATCWMNRETQLFKQWDNYMKVSFWIIIHTRYYIYLYIFIQYIWLYSRAFYNGLSKFLIVSCDHILSGLADLFLSKSLNVLWSPCAKLLWLLL